MPPACHKSRDVTLGHFPSGHWDGGQFQLGLAYRVCLVAIYLAVVHVQDASVFDATTLPKQKDVTLGHFLERSPIGSLGWGAGLKPAEAQFFNLHTHLILRTQHTHAIRAILGKVRAF